MISLLWGDDMVSALRWGVISRLGELEMVDVVMEVID